MKPEDLIAAICQEWMITKSIAEVAEKLNINELTVRVGLRKGGQL